ncbi:MAG: hypothetical protein KGP14_03800, partial [Betaproteobacteria bacterium]|nr:hypothetical protein [Betaproteobacteria bacterium]
VLYKVSTAGTTTLDSNSSWAVNDYCVFDGYAWQKSQSSRQFERGCADMLAVYLAPDFGKQPSPITMKQASDAWIALQSKFIKPVENKFDRALIATPQRGYILSNPQTATDNFNG